jgi:uncharacterized protein (DUF2267 family)
MPPRIEHATLIEHVMRTGLPDRLTAELALRATIGALGPRLTKDEAEALASRLPEPLAFIVARCEHEADLDADAIYERVGRRSGTPTRIAREQADIVLAALAAHLDDELKRRLIRALPEPLAERFRPHDPGEVPPHRIAVPAPTSTLATGRPGSSRPLSEARPERAHTESVARSDDPHAETKLSSSRGLTQERLGETLATGRPPGPRRSIA